MADEITYPINKKVRKRIKKIKESPKKKLSKSTKKAFLRLLDETKAINL